MVLAQPAARGRIPLACAQHTEAALSAAAAAAVRPRCVQEFDALPMKALLHLFSEYYVRAEGGGGDEPALKTSNRNYLRKRLVADARKPAPGT